MRVDDKIFCDKCSHIIKYDEDSFIVKNLKNHSFEHICKRCFDEI